MLELPVLEQVQSVVDVLTLFFLQLPVTLSDVVVQQETVEEEGEEFKEEGAKDFNSEDSVNLISMDAEKLKSGDDWIVHWDVKAGVDY